MTDHGEKRTLEQLCLQITDGKHGDCTNEFNSGYYFVSVKDVKDNAINYSEARQITQADFQEADLRTKFEMGDILVTNSGTIGRMAMPTDPILTRRTTFQKSVAILKPNPRLVNRKFLFYYLKSKLVHLVELSGGTAQKNLLLKDLRAFDVELPDKSVQGKIVVLLSGIDDLMDNNTHRIEVLEKTIKLIFDEWFVKFKFPGHGKVKMVESELGEIPKGWESKNLGDILSELESGSRPKGGVGELNEGIPSIGAENIDGLGNYDFAKEKFVSEGFFKAMYRGILKHKDVLLYKDGAKIGRKSIFRNDYPHSKCCINEHVFILRTNQGFYQDFLYFWLDQDVMTEKIKNLNSNAAQAGINQESVRSLPITIPTREVVLQFDDLVEPLLNELFTLAKKNRILSITRDLLLPRVVSGEIDLSNLDIRDFEMGA